MILDNITIERLEEIEKERQETQSNPEFFHWMKKFNVGRMFVDREGIFRAKEMMRDYSHINQQNGSGYLWH